MHCFRNVAALIQIWSIESSTKLQYISGIKVEVWTDVAHRIMVDNSREPFNDGFS